MKRFPGPPPKVSRLDRPTSILDEVKLFIEMVFPGFDFQEVEQVYEDVKRLFAGDYPGYRPCNTGYHDLPHTEACLRVLAKLIHGAFLDGYGFSEKGLSLGLISALMHDTGYIQTSDDLIGTGGKYTLIHIDRSIQFLKAYLAPRGYTVEDLKFCENCLKCTGLHVNIAALRFLSLENELLGKMLGTADLLGQMADPHYLEKLPELYREFREAGIQDYESERDFLEKTPQFWEFTRKRFATELGNVVRFLKAHYRASRGIDRDLEQEAIQRNIERLQYVLKHHPNEYYQYLKPGKGPAGT